MSLPSGFLDELQSRLMLSQVVGRKVVWDKRKSNQAKGDMWAPCPFHQEKTASFHVDDRKGFYHCFGCHASGDAISFVRETENVDFIEAVRILAAEAGMPMPERDPQARALADRHGKLIEVMEQAARWFGLQLRAGAGALARDYLRGRGLDEATQTRFDLGFAPEGWHGLWDHLTAKGVAPEMILACGLARESTKPGKPYDVFRNRIMFPIRDARGRCIAFGGRAMRADDPAKYLNSPETELFDKSRTLYNVGPAREAMGKGQPLIVAEGYMDVIALSAAGFGAAVAPLGTAVTEHQLQMMWRMSAEPVIALDGDQAGLRAAYRVIDLALPLLEAGKSLRFVLMPDGKDPDDLLRSAGPEAFRNLLGKAVPMVQLLWQRETETRSFDSPERRAALDKALRDAIKVIRDPSIRNHYVQAIKEMRWQLFRAPSGRVAQNARHRRGWPAAETRMSAKSSFLVTAGENAETRLREAVILATLLCWPALIEDFHAQIERLFCRDTLHARLRDLILRNTGSTGKTDLALQIEQAMAPQTLENFMALPHVAIAPSVRPGSDEEVARMTLVEEFAKIEARRGLVDEIREASEDIAGFADEAVTWRLGQAAQACDRAVKTATVDMTSFVTAENGVRLDKDQLMKTRQLFSSIDVTRGGKPRRRS